MKILLLGNNEKNNLVTFLKKNNEDVILRKDKMGLQEVEKIKPDYIISYNYKYLIPKSIVMQYKGRIINLHTSLLPWNKGAHPNFWSFWEDTPKGVTIHLIDENIDTGDILVQKEITFGENETLLSTYKILQNEIQDLLIANWWDIKQMNIIGIRQKKKGTFHYANDINKFWNKIENNGGWNISIVALKRIKEEL